MGLRSVELTMNIEDELEVSVDDDNVTSIKTVASVQPESPRHTMRLGDDLGLDS